MQIVKNTTILYEPFSRVYDFCVYTKKANKLKTCSLYVGVDGFEPPTLCL